MMLIPINSISPGGIERIFVYAVIKILQTKIRYKKWLKKCFQLKRNFQKHFLTLSQEKLIGKIYETNRLANLRAFDNIFQMGNYCCEQNGENSMTKKKVSKKNREASTEDPSKIKENCQKEILSMIKSQKDVCVSASCPSIKLLKVMGELGKGGQAEIYEVVIQTEAQVENQEEIESSLALKRIGKPNSSYRASSIALGSQLLLQNKCPFLIEGLLCCQNQQFMYELMKIAEGGDLSTFMETTIGKGDSFRKLGEEGIKMVLAGVILGLQYIHHNGFIYCDLKVENVLIGKDGYPRLADFDLAAKKTSIPSEKYQSTMTTVGPQIFTQKSVDRGMDLWALGVFIFTLVYGEPPYTKQDIKEAGFIQECRRKENKYGLKRKRASKQILSLLNSLLKYKAEDRLGYQSISDIKKHQFFKNFDWEKYSKKEMDSPLAEIVVKYAKQRKQSWQLTVKQFHSIQSDISKSSSPSKTPIKNSRKTRCDIDVNSSMEN